MSTPDLRQKPRKHRKEALIRIGAAAASCFQKYVCGSMKTISPTWLFLSRAATRADTTAAGAPTSPAIRPIDFLVADVAQPRSLTITQRSPRILVVLVAPFLSQGCQAATPLDAVQPAHKREWAGRGSTRSATIVLAGSRLKRGLGRVRSQRHREPLNLLCYGLASNNY
jgi:hypothetical protein